MSSKTEEQLDVPIPIEIASYQSGKLSFSNDLAMPFLEEAVIPLVQEGITETSQYPIGFTNVQTAGPTAIFGVDDAIVGIALFLGTGMGQWAIGRICDGIWVKTVRPALRHLFQRRREEVGERALTFSFGAWFDTDGVFVQVITTLQQGEDAKKVEELVPEAFRRALTWIEQHGVQQPVLVYRIRGGNLSS